MAKLFNSWNAAITIAVLTSGSLVEVAAAAVATGDQDGMQHPDQMCDLPPDCNRVVDPTIEPGQDQKVEMNRIVDPDFKQEREPDHERIIDPGMAPVEDPETNRIIDPPEKVDPGSNQDMDRSSQLGLNHR